MITLFHSREIGEVHFYYCILMNFNVIMFWTKFHLHTLKKKTLSNCVLKLCHLNPYLFTMYLQ